MGNEFCQTPPIIETSLPSLVSSPTADKQSPFEFRVSKISLNKDKHHGFSEVYLKGSSKKLIYKGELKDSKFHGFGQVFEEGKLFYEGEFKNGLFEGWGITENYTGQFRQGHYDGYGIFRTFDNDDKKTVTFYYEGYFSMGKFSGNGIQIKGARIPNEKINKAIERERGMMDSVYDSIEHGRPIGEEGKNEEIYIGQFAWGYRNGVGRLFKNNKEFSGMFVAGKTVVEGTTVDWGVEERRRRNKQSRCMKC